MLKNASIFLSIFLFGCSTIHPNVPTSKVARVEEKNKVTSIFYYPLTPSMPYQAMAILAGRFEWKDECIYLVNRRGTYSTAMFPSYPKEDVQWDEESKTLNLKGHIFRMGDWIKTNGNYDTYVPNVGRFIEYENQGDKKCLTTSLAYVGTVSIR